MAIYGVIPKLMYTIGYLQVYTDRYSFDVNQIRSKHWRNATHQESGKNFFVKCKE